MGIAFVATPLAQSSLVNDVPFLTQYSKSTHLSDGQSVFEYVSLVHLEHELFHGNWDNTTGHFVTSFSIALDVFLRRLQVALQAHMLQASDYP